MERSYGERERKEGRDIDGESKRRKTEERGRKRRDRREQERKK